jgi:hypothetical protein
MTFTAWDWLVVGIAVVTVIALVWLVVVLLQLKNGPVNGFIRRGRTTSSVVWRLLGGLYRVTYGNDDQLTHVQSEIVGIADGLSSAVKTPAGATINYRTLLAAWGALRTGRGVLRQASGLLNRPKRGANAAMTATAVPPRHSLVDRLGLVPPAAKRVGRALPFARGAFAAYRELRRRGLL